MRKVSSKLKVLPLNSRAKKVPKPQVKPAVGDPLSMRGVKSRLNLNVPGVKTQ